MATLFADNYKKAYVNKPTEKIPTGEVSGGIKFAYDEITLSPVGQTGTTTIALNDVIKTSLRVTKGAKIIDAGIFIPASLGATGIFSLGRAATPGGAAADPDSLVATVDGGGQAALAKATAASVDLLKDIEEDELMFDLTCTEATPAIAQGAALKIKVWLQWCDV